MEAKLAELQAAIANSQKTISQMRGDNALMVSRTDALEKDLVASQSQNQVLEETRARLIDTNAQLASQSDNNVRLLAETQSKLEEARARGPWLWPSAWRPAISCRAWSGRSPLSRSGRHQFLSPSA